MHEKRAEVIAEAYSRLKNLYSSLADYVKVFEPAGGPSREQRREAASEAHRDYRNYYGTNVIFFPKAVAEKLEAIDFEVVKALNEFFYLVDMDRNNNNVDKWNEIFERVNTDIKSALSDLEEEFRRLLGDAG